MTEQLSGVPAVIARRYRVERLLGHGGMGDVYEAFDTDAKRAVALKRMHPMSGDAMARGALRFRREFHTLASLQHPRIVAAYDFGTDDGVPYYTMELLDGVDFKDLGVVAPVEVCRLLRDVAAALAMLHARGLVHRDLAAKNARRLVDGRAKLLDFGILASFGVAGEVAGTPAYVAPEALRGLPIDGRTDLYSLGVLAYVLLTGRAPYGGRSFTEVSVARQRTQAQPPSAYVADVPTALDDLVMSLLATDAGARPQTAAEVIARLSGIGGLADDAELEVRQGYLASAVMVGREKELGEARVAVERAVAGKGGTFFVRAESGTGKSRLLREIALEAKVSGALVASVSCETASPAPYATVEDVAAALLQTASADVLDAARPFAGVLSRVVPSLRERIPEQGPAPRADDPAEERLRVQRAVADWLVALSARTPLVLVVDDVQRCDEASATALAALARGSARARLLVVAAQRTGEEARAPAAVAALAAGERLVLGGLSEASLGDLVRALFGDAPNASRLAAQLHAATAGLPMHAMELARQLVDDGTIVYRAGLWVLPPDLRIESAPRTLADAMDARIRGLSDQARQLGEVLAVAGGALSLELVAGLANEDRGSASPREGSGRIVVRTFQALDELTTKGVLVNDGQRHRFQHDSAREALLRGLDAERGRALHEAVGARLLAEPNAEERAAEIGFHLLQGGDAARGADLLARAGTRLFEAQALADCIAPLEAALAAYEKLGVPRGRTMGLRAMLLAAGWVSDRAVGSRHALAVVRDYRAQAGIDLAARLRSLGRPIALVLGVALATLRWLVRPTAARGPSPYQASLTFAISVPYALGLAIAENRKEDVRALAALIEPLGAFRGRIPYAVYLVASAFPYLLDGPVRRAGRYFTEAIPAFQGDRLARAPESERKFAECGVRGLRVLVDVGELDPRVLADCDAMEAFGFRYYLLVVQATKVAYHRFRGEESKARAIERAMEIPSIQLGSWSTDVQVLLFAHPAYALCHDVLGLERSIAAIERLISQGFRWEAKLAITRGEWERERGNAAAAVAILEPLLASCEPVDLVMRQWVGSALAEALLAADRHAEARRVADDVLALGVDLEARIVMPHLRSRRIRALADAALGDAAAAKESLARAITECESLDFPPLAAAMHEACARIALAEGDDEAFRAHSAAVLRWVRPTENPALLGFAERLFEAGKAPSGAGSAPDDRGPTLRTPKPGSGSGSVH